MELVLIVACVGVAVIWFSLLDARLNQKRMDEMDEVDFTLTQDDFREVYEWECPRPVVPVVRGTFPGISDFIQPGHTIHLLPNERIEFLGCQLRPDTLYVGNWV